MDNQTFGEKMASAEEHKKDKFYQAIGLGMTKFEVLSIDQCQWCKSVENETLGVEVYRLMEAHCTCLKKPSLCPKLPGYK